MPSPQIFTLPLDKPFVDVLACHVLTQYNTEQLPQVSVLLPNRRSCTALRDALLRMSQGKALVLPKIRAIGDVDEDALMISSIDTSPALYEALKAIPPAMPRITQQLMMTRLVYALGDNPDSPFQPSLQQASDLAQELVAFINEMEREGIAYDKLEALVPEQYAEHWQLTLRFLRIVTQNWPDILEREGVISQTARRNQLVHALAEHWQTHPCQTPVIAAGTTGTIPATARLLGVIAAMPQGEVILPGLDVHCDASVWQHLSPSHPQFQLKQLLSSMEVAREDIQLLDYDAVPTGHVSRARAVLRSMHPAECCADWHHSTAPDAQAWQQCSRLDTRTQEEEAALCAALLRETLETPTKQAALITQNRTLARKTAALLKRLDIHVDDSAGIALSQTQEAIFLLHIAELCQQRLSPAGLLSLWRHPLWRGELSAHQHAQATNWLEIHVLRGIRPVSHWQGLIREAEQVRQPHPDAIELLNFTRSIFEPLQQLMQQSTHILFSHMLEQHWQAASKLGFGEHSNDAFEMLERAFADISQSAEHIGAIEPGGYADTLSQLLSQTTYRPRFTTHPRLRILTPMEARLQHFDRIILAGLNEGEWPQENQPNPWLNHAMRTELGLPDAERHIGQSAHDFVMLCGAEEVFFTRANQVEGTVSIPSRFLQRLEALLDIYNQPDALASQQPYMQWLLAAQPQGEGTPLPPPVATPPRDARPTSLAATSMERLMRDPYGYYAQKILKLRKLDPLDKEPDNALFGTIVHKAMESYTKRRMEQNLPPSLELLLECGAKSFAPMMQRPAVQTFWWPRFESTAEWLIEQELARATPHTIEAEVTRAREWTLNGGTIATTTATIDRLEWHDTYQVVVDYKTGSPISKQAIALGYSCQLPLISLIQQQEDKSVGSAEFWYLKGGEEKSEIWSLQAKFKKAGECEDILESTEEGVRKVLHAYLEEDQPYYAVPIDKYAPPQDFNDYAHLARIKEWKTAG